LKGKKTLEGVPEERQQGKRGVENGLRGRAYA